MLSSIHDFLSSSPNTSRGSRNEVADEEVEERNSVYKCLLSLGWSVLNFFFIKARVNLIIP